MVFCCAWDSTLDPEEGALGPKPTSYPGQRRLVKTSGNALVDASEYVDIDDAEAPPPPTVPSCDTIVAVTVPEGVSVGDIIAVKSPDGKRTVNATVPDGMSHGSKFMVRFPPVQQPQPSPPAEPIPIVQTQLENQQDAPAFAESLNAFMSQTPVAKATLIPDPIPPPKAAPLSPVGKHASEESRQDDIRPNSFSESVDNISSPDPPQVTGPPPPAPPAVSPAPIPTPAPQQKFVLVNIPPGTTPGTTLHVEVPGENRTLAAQVPAGVTSFRVAYTPQLPEQLPPPRQLPQPQSVGQKLLLVHVPPGTSSGATLHVAVPDEPGRILAAQVPAGNIKQFHVAYEPRALRKQARKQKRQQQNPSLDPYSQQQTTMQGQHTSGHSSQYQHDSNNHRRKSADNNATQNNNNGFGDYVLPAVGAAALGTAAYATYEHFHHQNDGVDFDSGDGGGDFDF